MVKIWSIVDAELRLGRWLLKKRELAFVVEADMKDMKILTSSTLTVEFFKKRCVSRRRSANLNCKSFIFFSTTGLVFSSNGEKPFRDASINERKSEKLA